MLLVAGILIGARHPAAAHDVLGACVQHGVHLTVGAQHIDLTLDLTFFEEWSARERAVMDTDASGHISRAETESYLKKLAPHLSQQVKLRVAGRELELAPLYDPEIDLLANDEVGPAHHRLRLFFFAPTLTGLRADDEIVVEDRLWPAAKVLGTPQAEGRDGCTLTMEISIDPGFTPAQPGEGRLFKFRCLKPPTTKTSAPKAPPSSPLKPEPKLRNRSQLMPSPTPQTVP